MVLYCGNHKNEQSFVKTEKIEHFLQYPQSNICKYSVIL